MSEIREINRHLNELRTRILRIVICVGIVIAFILSFHFTPIEFSGLTLYYPEPQPLDNIAAQIANQMKMQLVPENVTLIQTAPGQAFFAQIYIAALVGIVVSMPIVVRELSGFIAPALKENEIKVGRSIALPALGLFVVGCVFARSGIFFAPKMTMAAIIMINIHSWPAIKLGMISNMLFFAFFEI